MIIKKITVTNVHNHTYYKKIFTQKITTLHTILTKGLLYAKMKKDIKKGNIMHRFFLVSLLFLSSLYRTIQTQESYKQLYFINETNKRVRAIFFPIFVCMEANIIHESNEQTICTIEFGFYLNASNDVQEIILGQQKMGTSEVFEGILNTSTATECRFVLYDTDTQLTVKKTISIHDNQTYKITYENKKLDVTPA